MAYKKKKPKNNLQEPDSVYFLKVVLYFLLGCLWIQIGKDNGVVLPVGLIAGVIFASHDHFRIDKKIEYAVLLMAAILSFVTPIGFVLTVNL